jgi:hypothetical protein
LGLDLNEMPMQWNDVDDQPTQIIKLPQTCGVCPLLSNFVVEHLLKFLVVDVMNMQSFIDKLKKMLISNINKHRH